MRKGIVLAIGVFVISATAVFTGCGTAGDAPKIPVTPKWKGAPYRIALDAPSAKPNPSGVTIPTVKYTANPDELETRATLVVRFDSSEITKKNTEGPRMNKMIMGPVDIKGEAGALPDDYMAAADKGLAQFLGAYCMKGKIKISVALARSSLTNQAGDAEVENKRLSDWLPVEITFKNPHPKC